MQQDFFLNGERIGGWMQRSPRQREIIALACANSTLTDDPGYVYFAPSLPLRSQDVLTTACTYSTQGAVESIIDGMSATNEMCSAFLQIAWPCSGLSVTAGDAVGGFC